MSELSAPRSDPTPRTGRGLRTLEVWTFPLVVFLALAALYMWRFRNEDARWTVEDHFHWDATHYFTVARGGYVAAPCDANSENLCGNAGWFPGLALVGAAAMKLLPPSQHGAVLAASWMLSLASFYLLYLLVRRKYDVASARLALLSAAAFPTAFYHLLAFPYALYTALSLFVAYAIERRWWWLAIPAAMYLGATYPSGALIAGLAGWPVLQHWFGQRASSQFVRRANRREDLARLAIAAAAIGGTVAFSLYCYKQFNDFFLYVHFQQKYGHSTGAIVQAFKDWLVPKWRTELPVTIMVVYAFVTSLAFFGRRVPTEWTLYGLAILLFTPVFGTFECYYRHIVPCWPLHVAIAVSPAPWRVKLAWCVIGVVLGLLYFAPTYANLLLV